MEQQPPAYLFALILVAFPVVFIAFWSGVCGLIALLSGWRSMAQRYPCPEGLQGRLMASGLAMRVGLARYNGVISLEAAPAGLIVRVMKLFPFHAPVLLPWGALRMVRGRVGFLSFAAGSMVVEGGSTFELNEDAFVSIEQALRMRG